MEDSAEDNIQSAIQPTTTNKPFRQRRYKPRLQSTASPSTLPLDKFPPALRVYQHPHSPSFVPEIRPLQSPAANMTISRRSQSIDTGGEIRPIKSYDRRGRYLHSPTLTNGRRQEANESGTTANLAERPHQCFQTRDWGDLLVEDIVRDERQTLLGKAGGRYTPLPADGLEHSPANRGTLDGLACFSWREKEATESDEGTSRNEVPGGESSPLEFSEDDEINSLTHSLKFFSINKTPPTPPPILQQHLLLNEFAMSPPVVTFSGVPTDVKPKIFLRTCRTTLLRQTALIPTLTEDDRRSFMSTTLLECLRGKARSWYTSWEEANEDAPWEEFEAAFLEQYDDLHSSLGVFYDNQALTFQRGQKESLVDYMDRAEKLYDNLKGEQRALLLTNFVNRLNDGEVDRRL